MICKFCNKETAIIRVGLAFIGKRKILHVHKLDCELGDEYRVPTCLKCLKIKVMINALSGNEKIHYEECFHRKHGESILKFIKELEE